ncbi:MAG TPA: hypothetical protein VIA98_14450 [Allosphingosinicella sp.]|jgi:uncharacterized lipoprotein
MRALLAALPLLLLAACSEEPENIQTKADNMSRALVEEANRIEAEATANVAAETAPLDNEAEALLNQAAQNAVEANAAADSPEAANGL